MTITVGDIYTQFPGFNPKDMITLMNGRTDFDGSDTVPLANIAGYSGGYARELSIFTAKQEGKSFTGMLHGEEGKKISAEAGIQDDTHKSDKKARGIPSSIPMDTSVWDIAQENTTQNV